LCADEVGANAGESPVGRIGLFTTENCVGEWGREASSASTARIEQAGRNENELHSMRQARRTCQHNSRPGGGQQTLDFLQLVKDANGRVIVSGDILG
jgi:hypothetical protein